MTPSSWPEFDERVWPAVATAYRSGNRTVVDVRDHFGLIVARVEDTLVDPRALLRDYEDALLLTYVPDGEPRERPATPRPGRENTLGQQFVDGTPGWVEKYDKIRLGRPDLLVYRCGWRSAGPWHDWSDGTWRAPVQPVSRTHTALVTPQSEDGSLVKITITGGDGKSVDLGSHVVDSWDRDYQRHLRIRQVLSERGWSSPRYETAELPGGVLWLPLRRGRLADRPWCTEALVRVVRDTCSCPPGGGEHLFATGTSVRMMQWGNTGDEVTRDEWWSSTDVDCALVLHDQAVSVERIIVDVSPWWDVSTMNATQIEMLLEPHYPTQAHDVARAWVDMGLHVAHEWCGLAIRIPAPSLRQVGRMPRDPGTGKLTGLYEVVQDDGTTRPTGMPPMDPVTEAAL